jgi:hypothetical protein
VAKQISEECIIASGGHPGNMLRYMLQKIIGGGERKRKYLNRKDRARNKGG